MSNAEQDEVCIDHAWLIRPRSSIGSLDGSDGDDGELVQWQNASAARELGPV